MSLQLFDLSDRTALVTGSSRGIGLALARALGEAGARLLVNGRNPETVAAACKTLQDEQIDASAAPFDVTDPEQVHAAVESAENHTGQIDILVNNAGIQHRGRLDQLSLQAWQQLMDVNLTSAFLVGQAVARRMLARKHGKIINICSLQSEVARPGIAAYSAAKGGLKMLTRGMCADWAGSGIQVNAIAPGYFVTELTRPLRENEEFDAWLTKRTPAGRWGQTSELAGTAVFLASSASDFVNGQIIYVDGGVLAVL